MSGPGPHYCADAFAVRQLGFATWLEAPGWPLADADFMALTLHLQQSLSDALDGLHRRQVLILLSDTGVVDQIGQWLNIAISDQLARRSQTRVLGADGAHAGWITRPADAVAALRLAGGRSPLRQAAASVAKRYVFNRHARLDARVMALLGRTDTWLIGSMSDLKAAYLARTGQTCRAFAPTDFMGGAAGLAAARPDAWVGPVVKHVLDEVAEHVRKTFDVELGTDPGWQAIGRSWEARLAALTRIFDAVVAQGRHPAVAIVGETGKPLNKIVGAALGLLGSHVIGTNHGNFVGEANHSQAAIHLAFPCAEILCYSDANARLMEASARQSAFWRHHDVRFSSDPQSNPFPALACRYSEPVAPGAQGTVMIVGNPMNATRYAGCAGHFFTFMLAAEARMVVALRQAGIPVLYKAHPERLAEIEGYFESLGAEVLKGRFEQDWSKAGVFAFASTLTTVFNLAVLTDRPIVSLDIAGFQWSPEAIDDLRARVAFVPAGFDAVNDLTFDTDAFCRACSDAHAGRDAYRRRFLLDDASGGGA